MNNVVIREIQADLSDSVCISCFLLINSGLGRVQSNQIKV